MRFLKIGHYVYRVKMSNSMKPLGTTDLRQTVIRLNREQSADSMADTLAHEILHAALYIAGYGYKEKMVGRLAPILVQTLRDNPWAVEELLG